SVRDLRPFLHVARLLLESAYPSFSPNILVLGVQGADEDLFARRTELTSCSPIQRWMRSILACTEQRSISTSVLASPNSASRRFNCVTSVCRCLRVRRRAPESSPSEARSKASAEASSAESRSLSATDLPSSA